VDRDFEDAAAVDEGVGEVADFRGAVGVGDFDGDDPLADGRGARGSAEGVAVVGGGDGDAVAAGLQVAWCPADFERFGVEGGAVGEAVDLIGDGRRGGLRADRGLAVGQADPGLEFGVVRVEGEDADSQRLAFADAPGVGRFEDRRAVGVDDVEDDVAGDRAAGAFAGGGGPRGVEQEGDAEAAVLGVARGPFEPAGFGVERGAAGEPGGGVFEAQRAAVGLRGVAPAGDAADELQGVALAFAQGLRRDGLEFGLRLPWFDGDRAALADGGLAVAD